MNTKSNVLVYLSLTTATSIAAGCDDPEAMLPEEFAAVDPDDSMPVPQSMPAPQGCAPGDLLNGSVLASHIFVRGTGKPTDEFLDFSTNEERLCIVVITDHEDGKASPGALSIALDESEVFGPSDFNAAPASLVREIDAGAGSHELAVRLMGKPGGRAFVAVLAVPSVTLGRPTLDPLTIDRLEDPSADETIVKDEAIVVTTGLDGEPEFFAALAELPFPVFVTSRLQNVPVYRVYLPGAGGGDDLHGRLAAIEQIATVTSAGVHRVGGIDVESLPKQGDGDYITHGHEQAPQDIDTHNFNADAWHLRRINAGRAWTWMDTSANITARTVVMDNGFNLQHPDIAGNQGQCWTLDADRHIVSGACAPEDFEPANAAGRHHGTAVFGLLAAQAGNTSPDHASTVGVVWNGAVDLARFDQLQVVQEDNSVIVRGTNFTTALTAEQIVLGPDGIPSADDRQIINMSFGNPPFIDNSDDPDIDLAELNAEIDSARAVWQSFIDAYQDVLLVNSAGNYGDRCPGGQGQNNPDVYCSTQARRGPCTLSGDSDQILCVQASDVDDEIWPGTSTGGSPLAAPGAGMSVLDYEGTALRTGGNGTSYAAPLVAGAAALLRTLYPSLTPGEVHDVLIASASPINDEVGRLDVASAIRHVACGVVPPVEQHCPNFYDLKGHWSAGPVHQLACDCVLDGYDDGRFRPQEPIKREEALKVILILSQPGVDFQQPEQSPYGDVPASAWYAGYVDWASDHGLLETWLDDQNHFNPGTPVPRGAFIRLLVEAAQISSEPEFDALAWAFEQYQGGQGPAVEYDDDDEPDYLAHANHINAATSRCIVSGYADSDNFGASELLLRSEAAKIACLVNYGLDGGCDEILDDPCEPFEP